MNRTTVRRLPRVTVMTVTAVTASLALLVVTATTASAATPTMQAVAGPALAVADLPVAGGDPGRVGDLLPHLGRARYLAAGGDPGEVERAKGALRSAGIGYALALLAPVILAVLKSILGVP